MVRNIVTAQQEHNFYSLFLAFSGNSGDREDHDTAQIFQVSAFSQLFPKDLFSFFFLGGGGGGVRLDF